MAAIYLFGFEPFDGRGLNASWEAVNAVPLKIGRRKVVKQKLPVLWGEAFRMLQHTVKEKPTAIFAVGEAPRKTVCVETWGYNERIARTDNHGLVPRHLVIHPGTTDRVSIPWNPTPVVATLAERYPLELSTDPGRFLCNEVIYELYREWANPAATFPLCFLHVPILGTRIPRPGGEFVATAEALGLMLTEFVKASLAGAGSGRSRQMTASGPTR